MDTTIDIVPLQPEPSEKQNQGANNSNADKSDAGESTQPNPWLVRGHLRLGRMFQGREEHATLENPDLRQLLKQPVETDAIIEAVGAQFLVVDADTHHLRVKPTPEQLTAYESAVHPQPDAYWISHGSGLKLIYIGPAYRARAISAAMSLADLFHVELLDHTRHPLSARSDMPGAKCGPVSFGAVEPPSEFRSRLVGHLCDKDRQTALEKLGLIGAERFDHDLCPIDPSSGSDAKACVVVLQDIVFCHRCASHGVSVSPDLKPGVFPLANALGGSASTHLKHLVDWRVHWTHAQHELQHFYPNRGARLLKEAYCLGLLDQYGTDPRIKNVFNEHLDVVLGSGLWLRTSDLQPTKVDNDLCNGLPYCQYVIKAKNGASLIKIDPVKRAQLKYRHPEGYTPVHPYRGILFRHPEGVIPLMVPPGPKHAIELLTDPMPLDEAFQKLAVHFPGVHREFLMGGIAAAICAEMGGGQPPFLAVTGPSGSGKGETPRLAASFFGEDVIKVETTDDTEKFFRGIGMVLASGQRFLTFDELGRIPRLPDKLGNFLQLGAFVDWRPLFANYRVKTPCRAAFFLPCVRFPDYLRTSAEFLRRTRSITLHRKVPGWKDTSGGDTCDWRDRTPENAFIANSILTHAWRLCREHHYTFF
ncbi:MAG TPA: hypothetical protein VKV04_02550 [Verrucomicrobiae bacterium]|nr:hypothetical protein [Verrucomicrobiae bacterium]